MGPFVSGEEVAPKQKPGKSVQSVATPPEFITAVKNRLGIVDFEIDLAASADNQQAPRFYGEEADSLKQEWARWWNTGWAWLNPPYADIAPWVEKANVESRVGAKIAMLVPASVGSNWWNYDVHEIAHVAFLSPRLTFVGHTTPYPKDLALLLYAPYLAGGYTTWRWK